MQAGPDADRCRLSEASGRPPDCGSQRCWPTSREGCSCRGQRCHGRLAGLNWSQLASQVGSVLGGSRSPVPPTHPPTPPPRHPRRSTVHRFIARLALTMFTACLAWSTTDRPVEAPASSWTASRKASALVEYLRYQGGAGQGVGAVRGDAVGRSTGRARWPKRARKLQGWFGDWGAGSESGGASACG